jgi:REP element-mobilizing transposase RayT
VIAEKSIELECKVATINGIEDHIHVAVKRPPKIAPAEWVRNVKGASAHEVNTHFPNLPTYFRWQKHYGMLTVGVRHLHIVIDYIRKQKEHHANGTTIASLERTGEDDD